MSTAIAIETEQALHQGKNKYETPEAYYAYLSKYHSSEKIDRIKTFVDHNEQRYHFIPMMTIAIIDEFGINNFIKYASNIRSSVPSSSEQDTLCFRSTSNFFSDNRELFNDWGKHVAKKLGLGDYLVWIAGEFTCFYPDFTADDVVGFMVADNRGMEGFKTFAHHACWSLAIDTCVNYSYFSTEYDQKNKA